MDPGYPSQIHQYASNNRVYINRNFNRIGTEGLTLTNSNVMYLNPNFSHNVSSQQQQNNPAIRPKIHVNPNFMRSTPQEPSKSSLTTLQNTPVPNNSQINILSAYGPTNMCNQLVHPQPINIIKPESNLQMTTTSNSRYCLVRQKENKDIKALNFKNDIKSNKIQTVKVSKYKLVSLNTVKKNLVTNNTSSSKVSETNPNQHNFLKSKSSYTIRLKHMMINSVQNNRFKFVKRNSLTALQNEPETKQSTIRRVSITRNKVIIRSSFRNIKKMKKGTMKKNNIPCPVFRKYGKCLRKERASCDYLHDKKHVSICRKFLKGNCHNDQCLLSHDLTDNKMPTCHFYLQGTCTKEGCPYLHVKLNEKAKICQDFVKGYCEKGNKCIHRHVNSISKIKTSKHNSYRINKKTNIERDKNNRKQLQNNDNGEFVKKATEKQSDKECTKERYFKDVADTVDSENCDFIKPSRSKLGTLPSFIQL